MDPWKRLHNEFKALMEEEDRIVRQRELRDWFHATVIYEEFGEFGWWSFANSATESLQARFELLATEAGIALNSPPGTVPRDYWLHRLFVDLRANNSQHIRIYTDAGGFILRLFEASATFCTRLDRRSLEKSVITREDPGLERRAADLPNDVNTGACESPQSELSGGTLSEAKNEVMPAPELAGAPTGVGADRNKLVNDFLDQCNRESAPGFKVIRKHIWLAAGHAHARQFQYWQAGSGKTTDEDHRTFRRILGMPPSDFLALLKNKGIFPPRP
jgi:hypothetical protein